MQDKIVRPALLSIIGVYSPFYIAAVYWPLASTPGGFGLITGTGVLLMVLGGAWLSTISILLLLDNVQHRIWGLMAAISYTIAFPSLFFYSWFLTSSQVGAWPAMITPLVGLIGGVWGFLWRSSTAVATPGTVDMKAPSLCSFHPNRGVEPCSSLCVPAVGRLTLKRGTASRHESGAPRATIKWCAGFAMAIRPSA